MSYSIRLDSIANRTPLIKQFQRWLRGHEMELQRESIPSIRKSRRGCTRPKKPRSAKAFSIERRTIRCWADSRKGWWAPKNQLLPGRLCFDGEGLFERA